MRQLKIVEAKSKDHLYLEEVPEEFIFIQSIAKKYADSNEEVKTFYLKGIETAQRFKSEVSEKTYHSKVAWIVEQTIKSTKM